MSKQIAYKVVEKGTRWCSNWALFKGLTINSKFSTLEDTKNFKAVNLWRQKNKEWFPRYFKGSIVKKAPGSVGILAFEDEASASSFARVNFAVTGKRWCRLPTRIIKVRGIGKPNKNVRIAHGCGRLPQNINDELQIKGTVPCGTVAYNAVEVLE